MMCHMGISKGINLWAYGRRNGVAVCKAGAAKASHIARCFKQVEEELLRHNQKVEEELQRHNRNCSQGLSRRLQSVDSGSTNQRQDYVLWSASRSKVRQDFNNVCSLLLCHTLANSKRYLKQQQERHIAPCLPSAPLPAPSMRCSRQPSAAAAIRSASRVQRSSL
eukprot:731916-Pleurochrysis_carterae.AAC.1